MVLKVILLISLVLVLAVVLVRFYGSGSLARRHTGVAR